jgi:hypothetical protein
MVLDWGVDLLLLLAESRDEHSRYFRLLSR